MIKYLMRLVVQRVSKAQVSVENKIVGQIDKGLFVLIGMKKGDTNEMAELLADKLFKLRVMADGNSKMNKAVNDVGGSFLIVSQFSLNANTKDGNRPSFIEAEEPQKAKELYEQFIKKLEGSGLNIETGVFGAYMNIEAQLDGPVTIILESRDHSLIY